MQPLWELSHRTISMPFCLSACRDKYRVLERFEVQVPDAQLDLLDRLDGEWAKFQVSSIKRLARCVLPAACAAPSGNSLAQPLV